MTENIHFNYVFQYIENESILLDKDEFMFQVQSHPSYPSLLSISDTLTFFNIANGAFHIDFSETELLPDNFIALLKEANNKPQLYFLKKRGEKYLTIKDKDIYEIDYSSLESRWLGMVLLIEKSEIKNTINTSKDIISWKLPVLCLLMFLLTLFQVSNNPTVLLFFLFPTVGILFSIAALKDLFGTKSKLINSFCDMTHASNCTSVISSEKWKIFKIINFSDLSIIFFISQFLGLFILLLAEKVTDFLTIQKILLLASLPVILLSLYYQKFVEKKWCPICLAISSVILLEVTYSFIFLTNLDFNLSLNATILFSFIFICTILVWVILKNILTRQRVLKELQLKANRLTRNYEVFKNSLVSTQSILIPPNYILLGNHKSNTQISVITNPFCGHCKELHKILDKILNKYGQNIQVKMIFKTNFELDRDEIKYFFRVLMTLYIEKGEISFRDSLNHFFENGDLEEWNQSYQISSDTEKIDKLYNEMNDWCLENEINYTPDIFINGYKYPSAYEREGLEFFINDLIEDNSF